MNKGIKIAFVFLISMLVVVSLLIITHVYLLKFDLSIMNFRDKFDPINRVYTGITIVFLILITLRIPNVRILLSSPGQLFSKFILLFYGEENKNFMIPLFATYGLWKGYEGKYFVIKDNPEFTIALSMLLCAIAQIFLWYFIHLIAIKFISKK